MTANTYISVYAGASIGIPNRFSENYPQQKMERQSLIGFKEYLEKKDRIAVDISQLKKEITDTKVKSRLELEKLRVQQQLAKDISRAKASNV